MSRMVLLVLVFLATAFTPIQRTASAEAIHRSPSSPVQDACLKTAGHSDTGSTKLVIPVARTTKPAADRPRGSVDQQKVQSGGKLAKKVTSVLDRYYAQPLNTKDDPPWSVLHWAIAYGVDAQVKVGGTNGKRMTAIGWLCCNRPCAGKRLISMQNGAMKLPVSGGIQGHHGQFLSMLAQSRVPSDYVLRVGGENLEITELVEHEKKTCRSGMELTFKLIGIAHYTPTDEPWKNDRGETWSVERLLQEEIEQPIDRMKACCGGTHRLMSLSYAVNRRKKDGLPVTDVWKTAEKRVQNYQKRAFQLQNRDGSFSTKWFERPDKSGDLDRRLNTSGHITEWLAYSLPEERLHEPAFKRAIYYVASLLDQNSGYDWHKGALGHALHALAIYEQRVLGYSSGQRMELASRNR